MLARRGFRGHRAGPLAWPFRRIFPPGSAVALSACWLDAKDVDLVILDARLPRYWLPEGSSHWCSSDLQSMPRSMSRRLRALGGAAYLRSLAFWPQGRNHDIPLCSWAAERGRTYRQGSLLGSCPLKSPRKARRRFSSSA